MEKYKQVLQRTRKVKNNSNIKGINSIYSQYEMMYPYEKKGEL